MRLIQAWYQMMAGPASKQIRTHGATMTQLSVAGTKLALERCIL